MSEDTEVTGPIVLNIWVSSTSEDCDIYATIRNIGPDGKDVLEAGQRGEPQPGVTKGWLRASHRKLDQEKSLPYRPYHAHDERQWLKPGEIVECRSKSGRPRWCSRKATSCVSTSARATASAPRTSRTTAPTTTSARTNTDLLGRRQGDVSAAADYSGEIESASANWKAATMQQSGLRVGLMVPINNTTMEPELLAWLPQGSTCRTLGIPRGKGTLTPADLPAYIAQAMTLAQAFAADDIDLVIYGCTAAGFMAGPDRDAEIAAELAAVTGKPVVTTASAMIAALREHRRAQHRRDFAVPQPRQRAPAGLSRTVRHRCGNPRQLSCANHR